MGIFSRLCKTNRVLLLIVLVALGYTIFTTWLRSVIWMNDTRCITKALTSPRLKYVRKYGFIVLVIISFGFVIFGGRDAKLEDDTFEQLDGNELNRLNMRAENFLLEAMDEDFVRCLSETAKHFSPVIQNNNSLINWQKKSYDEIQRLRHPIFGVMEKWNKILLSLSLESAIIQPSILFSALPSRHRNLLVTRKFNITNHLGSKNVITFGVLAKDVPKLEAEGSLFIFRKAGFKPHSVKSSALNWMQGENSASVNLFTSHIFYKFKEWCVHAVVFHERSSYFWHAALSPQKNKDIPPMSDLLFVKNNSAYEKFTFTPLVFKKGFLTNFRVPSMSHYFLFQIQSSIFLECDPTRGEKYFNATNYPKRHPYLSTDDFDKRTVIALFHLKDLFNPLLMSFWLWSGTMLGWYRQCGVIPYTTDVDLGTWVTEVDNLDYIIKELNRNEVLNIRERMGLLERGLEFNLNCKGLRVDIFFVYQETNGTWYAGHYPSKGYFFKYHHPNITLCSGELLGQKVQVPCESEKFIIQEYGPKWSEPVSSWNYISSVKNRGPNIYWDKNSTEKVYEAF